VTAASRRPRTPVGLGSAGKALWKRLVDAYTFEPWELPIVEMACRQADDLALLDDAIRASGILTRGSQGQARLAQAVTEARLARLALSRLLGQIKLPAETATGERPLTDRGRRAQRAAQTRWSKVAKVQRGKGAIDGETA